jgi:hypothetical protein
MVKLSPGFWWKIHLITEVHTVVEVFRIGTELNSRGIGDVKEHDVDDEDIDPEKYLWVKIIPPSKSQLYRARYGKDADQQRSSELAEMDIPQLMRAAAKLELDLQGKSSAAQIRSVIFKAEGFTKPKKEAKDV